MSEGAYVNQTAHGHVGSLRGFKRVAEAHRLRGLFPALFITRPNLVQSGYYNDGFLRTHQRMRCHAWRGLSREQFETKE